jgi:Ni/Fe-hydrogenase 1 B-type cytochrome subunit
MTPAKSDIARVYVWELPVRISHWLIAGSIGVLSLTGLYIAHPFALGATEARVTFTMGWVRAIHFYTAIVFATAVTMRLVWMFSGNRYARWDNFVPVTAERRRGIWPTLQFYMFRRRTPPPAVGHNPVAGATYVLVFGLYFLEILTGLVLYAPYAGTGTFFGSFIALEPFMGGLQMARWIHHVGMWLLLGFAVHHVYSALLMTIVERTGTMESIFSGYKFVPRGSVEAPETGVRR